MKGIKFLNTVTFIVHIILPVYYFTWKPIPPQRHDCPKYYKLTLKFC